jgi:hypothetical protein
MSCCFPSPTEPVACCAIKPSSSSDCSHANRRRSGGFRSWTESRASSSRRPRTRCGLHYDHHRSGQEPPPAAVHRGRIAQGRIPGEAIGPGGPAAPASRPAPADGSAGGASGRAPDESFDFTTLAQEAAGRIDPSQMIMVPCRGPRSGDGPSSAGANLRALPAVGHASSV